MIKIFKRELKNVGSIKTIKNGQRVWKNMKKILWEIQMM